MLWKDSEVVCMLHIKEINVFKLLDGKSFQSADLYSVVEKVIKDAGFNKTAVYTNI